MLAEVQSQLSRRYDGASFEQLFNIRYRDDQPMQTWGGIFVAPAMRPAFDAARFDELEQCSHDARMFDTTVEPLTTREVIHLNRQLPATGGGALTGEGVPPEALGAYERLFRFYPSVPAAM